MQLPQSPTLRTWNVWSLSRNRWSENRKNPRSGREWRTKSLRGKQGGKLGGKPPKIQEKLGKQKIQQQHIQEKLGRNKLIGWIIASWFLVGWIFCLKLHNFVLWGVFFVNVDLGGTNILCMFFFGFSIGFGEYNKNSEQDVFLYEEFFFYICNTYCTSFAIAKSSWKLRWNKTSGKAGKDKRGHPHMRSVEKQQATWLESEITWR